MCLAFGLKSFDFNTETRIDLLGNKIQSIADKQEELNFLMHDMSGEIQQYVHTKLTPTLNKIEVNQEQLEQNIRNLDFKGKEVMSLTQQIKNITSDLTIVRDVISELHQNQQYMMEQGRDILDQMHPNITEESHDKAHQAETIPAKDNVHVHTEQTKQTCPVIKPTINLPYNEEIDKEVRQQMLACIPKSSE